MEVLMGSRLTVEQVLALPPTVDVVTACAALGLGRTLGYELIRRGAFPTRVLKVGRRYLIPTADLRAVLGLPDITPARDER
jgi:Helix-turn-helix domain